ncbi:MAG: sigma-54-dependent Fis family transcriptional regulator, partial [Deltaproteobacteria bacterium]|nr:sigma-54-dependent Fis family transcriptional regulator [Deltaproteobacteria bacterium]
GSGGLEVLSKARSEGTRTLIIVITAASTMNNAVEAMKRGAHDYLTKPFENLDLVAAAVGRAIDVASLEKFVRELAGSASDLSRLRDEVNRQLVGSEIIGRSPAMQEVYKLIGRVVTNDATVLICGESGTGKELVARAIHCKSPRWCGPFVAVNCSAIPPGLLESELFGHERGAFTGASEKRTGKFEQAAGGTLFLDEIADLPLELQPKLLRVLQEREFSRVGGLDILHAQVRIIAATNHDLEAAVAADKFREDLYFRLRVIPISLPALRERREDIAELTDYFVSKAAREMGAHARYVAPEARVKLQAYGWPGNVRELENSVLRSALLTPGNTIRQEDIELGRSLLHSRPPQINTDASLADLIGQRIKEMLDNDSSEPHDLYQKLISELERPLIQMTLKRARGNQVHAARILGLNRNTLRKKLVEHGIPITKQPA